MSVEQAVPTLNLEKPYLKKVNSGQKRKAAATPCAPAASPVSNDTLRACVARQPYISWCGPSR